MIRKLIKINIRKEKSILILWALVTIWFPIRSQNLFTRIPSSLSNIKFENRLIETKDLNVLNYEYMYNGAGVAIGDINNDGLLDVFFAGNMSGNKLYLNQGKLKFKDISEAAGISSIKNFHTGVSMVDVNGDGWLDIYVCKSGMPRPEDRKNALYINNKNGTFSDKAKFYGIDDASPSTQAYFFDFDNDKDLDLLLVNHPYNIGVSNKINLTYIDGEMRPAFFDENKELSDRYYENQNGKFVDRTKESGLEDYAFGLSAIVSDFNGDGFFDIYIANDFNMPDVLMINNKNGSFTDLSDSYFKHFSFFSMGSDCADIDNDGFDEVVVLDMLPDSNYRQKQFDQMLSYDQYEKLKYYGFKAQFVKNVVQWNQKGKGFSDISFSMGMAHTDWSWAPLIADFDNDGHKDVYITNGFYRNVLDQDISMYKMDSLAKSVQGQNANTDLTKILSTYSTLKIPNYYFKNLGNLQFSANPIHSGLDIPSWSNGAAYGDLDNDGDLDILVNNINQEAFLFRNNSSDQKQNNYIRIKLLSKYKESYTFGTRIEVVTEDSASQFISYNPIKGYMSCHENYVHFGLGKSKKVDLIISMRNGQKYILKNLDVNKLYPILLDTLVGNHTEKKKQEKPMFENLTIESAVSHWVHDAEFIDYKQEPLLPHKFSSRGPSIAVADVNKDNLEDFFISGSIERNPVLYIQNAKGRFLLTSQKTFESEYDYETTGSEFIDYDHDGDMDLIVVSGGNRFVGDEKMYPVRLYKNDGTGQFALDTTSMERKLFVSGKAVAISDYNRDGYPDIFIGGRIIPGHFGKQLHSYILNNRKGKFQIDTLKYSDKTGFISDAKWIDMDKNGWDDLILVGEWMNPLVYYNREGKLSSNPSSLLEKSGWWTSIHAADLNQDGLVDFVLGNYGTNTRYQATEQGPLTMYVNDFDKNGSTDAIINYYQKGISYPLPLRDVLLDQLPSLKKRFNRYEKYSRVTTKELFDSLDMNNAKIFKTNTMQSVLAFNLGNGQFSVHPLPIEAQFFPVNAINTSDLDGDGDVDILLSGNDYGIELQAGRLDAGRGLVLINDGNGLFSPKQNTGYNTLDDVKQVKPIRIGKTQAWIVGKNNGFIQIIGKREQ